MEQTTQSAAAGRPAKPGRIESLDAFRALAILAVVGIHVCGHFLPDLQRGGFFWLGAAFANRALQFAVPAFLTLSAFLNIRPLLRGEPLREYGRRRLLRALWPYVLWTLLYALFDYRLHLWDLRPGTVIEWLLTGDAYFHLYFLLLVLQLYVLLPLIARVLRWHPRAWVLAGGTLAIQLLIYIFNKRYWQIPSPGSVIIWYLPSVMMGAWLGARSRRLSDVVRWGTPAALVVALVSGAVYVKLGLDLLWNHPLSTFAYQTSLWLYAPAATFLLLAIAERFVGTSLKRWLDPVGAYSLEIYLVHPLVIWGLDKTLLPVLRAKAAMPVYFVLCVLLPMALAWVLARLRLSRWVWGVDPPAAHRPAPAHASSHAPSHTSAHPGTRPRR